MARTAWKGASLALAALVLVTAVARAAAQTPPCFELTAQINTFTAAHTLSSSEVDGTVWRSDRSITVEMWARMTEYPSPAGTPRKLFEFYDSTAAATTLSVSVLGSNTPFSGDVTFSVQWRASAVTYSATLVPPANSFPVAAVSSWTHYAFAIDTVTTARFTAYVNGTLHSSTTTPDPSPPSTPLPTSVYFKFDIDPPAFTGGRVTAIRDLRVWDFARNGAAIWGDLYRAYRQTDYPSTPALRISLPLDNGPTAVTITPANLVNDITGIPLWDFSAVSQAQWYPSSGELCAAFGASGGSKVVLHGGSIVLTGGAFMCLGACA
eukprot:tig00020902_g14996.t1